MNDWFRPFGRARTPKPGSSSSLGGSSSSRTGDSRETEDKKPSRPRRLSKVSSYLGLRPATPPAPALDTFQCTRRPEDLYHKPSSDQMVETLKVVMMNKPLLDAIPTDYNSCILHVLEGYQDLREQINVKMDIIEELKQSHTKDITEFESLISSWDSKEQRYKADIKRLEVILASTEAGLETVAMARSRSVVHGSERASVSTKRAVRSIKTRHARELAQESEQGSIAAEKTVRDIRMRHVAREALMEAEQRNSERQSANAPFEGQNHSVRTKRPSQFEPETTERNKTTLQLHFASDPSSSSYDSNRQRPTPPSVPSGSGLHFDENPFSFPPLHSWKPPETQNITGSPALNELPSTKTSSPSPSTRPARFSFQLGDDRDFSTKTRTTGAAKSYQAQENIRHAAPANTEQPSEMLPSNIQNTTGTSEGPNLAESKLQLPIHQTSRQSHHLHSSTNSGSGGGGKKSSYQALNRGTSGSSAVTAIRHTSGRGNAGSSSTNKAAIAAARAVVSRSWTGRRQRKKASKSGGDQSTGEANVGDKGEEVKSSADAGSVYK